MEHKSVMLQETIELLHVKKDGIYIDGTLGRAGHAKALIERLDKGHLYAFDKDENALQESKGNLKDCLDKVTLIQSDFRKVKERMYEIGIRKVDGMMLDLGVSSPQFDDPQRGFSYRFDARLDMRMNLDQTKDAYEVVNTYEVNDLIRIFKEYGEERYAKKIAYAIVENRPIETTFELVDVIKGAIPTGALYGKHHPAKQVFQAIRIEVNDELGALKEVLHDALDLLNVGGRFVVITFHSLEDRIVKSVFKQATSVPEIDKRVLIKASDMPQASFKLLTKKPIVASEEELEENHRSHSAKLRGIERTGESI